MVDPVNSGLNSLEWLGILGSIASIISIVINIIQGIKNKLLKSQLESVVFFSESTLDDIALEAKAGITSHAIDRESYFKEISAHAKTAKENLKQIKKRQL